MTEQQKVLANKYGYFSENGREFIITNPLTPRPWVNIISNSDFGLIVSQAGGGFSWRNHVNLNRLTRWYQDLIKDDWGKWLYLKDLDSGALFSLAFQPIQAEYISYRAVHGLGYTRFEQTFKNGLKTEWTLFVDKDEPLEVWLCKIENTSPMTKRLALTSYLEWNLGAGPEINREFHKLFIDTRFDSKLNAILAQKVLWEVQSERGHWNTEWPFVAFHSLNTSIDGWDTSKDFLLGRLGSYARPRGILQNRFSMRSGRFEDAVAAINKNFSVEPGQSKSFVFLLGQIEIEKKAKIGELIEKYSDYQRADMALQKVQDYWHSLTRTTIVQTPSTSFDYLTNIWLKYQAISGHLWARTGYYQQSGAFGFRDQLQTSQVWLAINPAKMREQLLLNARHQFANGKVLHWWHPITDEGLKTEMSDDLLWVPFMLIKYLKETADFDLLQEQIPYYDSGHGSLMEHCFKAIEVAFSRFSPRGLPLIGEGDWCDGFNAVGLDWKGESIWLGMFLFKILNDWIELLSLIDAEKFDAKIKLFREKANDLRKAVNDYGWNGRWFIGATRDDGRLIGDPSEQEAQIYLMSQTWAIISGIADEQKKERVIQAMLEKLESDTGLLLLYPAFSKPDKNVGYITRYAPGLRENGGVYTHAATWGVMALALMGKAEDALRIFNKLNPILQAKDNADRYWAEPYVLPGNSDGKDSAYYGRGGWTWYTGSAGWLSAIAHECIAGLKPEYDGLRIDPCISKDWKNLNIKRPFRKALFEIEIKNPDQQTGGVHYLLLNGKRMEGNLLPGNLSGRHHVQVILGAP